MDPIIGTPDDDSIVATNDADLIQCLAGNDTVYAGFDNDTIYGGDGDDLVYAAGSDDILYGQSGNDTLQTGSGNDLAYGGDGNDDIFLNAQSAGETTAGYGGTGDDTIRIYDPSDNTAIGGAGFDRLEISAGEFVTAGLALDFAAGTILNNGLGTSSTFSGFESLSVLLLSGDDTITASRNADLLNVGDGTNLVDARGGDDVVSYFVQGANTLAGGTGEDTLTASAALTPLYFIASDGTVDDGQLSVISGFEAYSAFGSVNDDITAFFTGNDSLEGRDGNDTGLGLGGDDNLLGQKGDDSLAGNDGLDLVYGGDGNDILTGGTGADLLGGGRGNDLVDAGDGRDRIFLYLGDDTVTGDTGADRFTFSRTESGTHTITDFETGTDRLIFNPALLQFGPDTGPLDPSLLSIGGPSGPQAQFVVTYDATADQTVLNWDPNGDNPAGGVYGLARFEGDVTIAASDIFIL